MKTDRRDFLKQVTVLTAAAAVPGVMTTAHAKKPGKVVPRKVKAGEKVRLACVGIGFRGGEIIKEFEKTQLCEIVALCDIDMGAEHTKETLERHPDVPRYQDFRKMFAEMGNKIDAVSVGTPDHSHFPICMLAMSLGINVYVEKPMAHTFYECELMMEAEKKYGVVTQMGNQGHSEGNYFQFKAWKDAGVIKNVRAVTAHMNNSRRWHGIFNAFKKNRMMGYNHIYAVFYCFIYIIFKHIQCKIYFLYFFLRISCNKPRIVPFIGQTLRSNIFYSFYNILNLHCSSSPPVL